MAFTYYGKWPNQCTWGQMDSYGFRICPVDFWPILALIWVWKGPKTMVPGAHILQTSKHFKVVPVSLKTISHVSSGNLLQNRQKTDFWSSFGPIRGKNGLTIWPPGVILYTHLTVPLICLWTKFHGPIMETFWENGQRPKNIYLKKILLELKSIVKTSKF